MKNLILTTILVAMLSLSSRADEIVLQNGDRLSGALHALDEDGLVFESEFFGTVTAPWDAVAELRSDEPVYVVFDRDQTLVGALVVEDTEILIETVDAGTVQAPRSAIVAIRSETRQAEFLAELERQINPTLADLWAAAVDGALSLSSGNADTRSVNLGMRATRTTERDRTSFYLTSLFNSNTTSGVSLTTANTVRGGSRFEIDISDRAFTFAFADLEFDRFQDLDLRLVLGGGVGLNVTEGPRSAFQVFGGGSSNQEYFASGVRRNSGESVLGQEWTFRLNGATSLAERLAVYPNLTDPGEYRINFDSTATTRLNGWLSWQITLSDRFLSNPRPGKEQNDLLFTTGFRIILGEENVDEVGPGDIDFQ